MHHAAGHRPGFVDFDGVAHPGQVIGGGQAAGTGADDQHPLAGRLGGDFKLPVLLEGQIAEEAFDVAEAFGVSRFPCREFPRMPRVCDSVAFRGDWRVLSSSRMWPSLSVNKVGTPGVVISELDGWPACAPVNASPRRLPVSAHDSGSRWFATPFLYGSFIRYSLPALTGAFMASPEFPLRAKRSNLNPWR